MRWIYAVKKPTDMEYGDAYIPIHDNLVMLYRKRGERVYRIAEINCLRDLRILVQENSLRKGFNLIVKFVKNFGASREKIDYVFQGLPYLLDLVVPPSLYRRVSRSRRHLVSVVHSLRGRARKWTGEVIRAVRYLIFTEKKKLGEVCRILNGYGIKISVLGLLKYRWRQIKPPPPLFR